MARIWTQELCLQRQWLCPLDHGTLPIYRTWWAKGRANLNVCVGFPQTVHDEIDSEVKIEIFEVLRHVGGQRLQRRHHLTAFVRRVAVETRGFVMICSLRWVTSPTGPNWGHLIYSLATVLCVFSPFSHTSLLYLCFASQMAMLGFYPISYLFKSPVTSIHAEALNILRESGKGGGVPWEDRSTKIFDRIRVWTPAACVAGKFFIHCAMPLRPVLWVIFWPPVWGFTRWSPSSSILLAWEKLLLLDSNLSWRLYTHYTESHTFIQNDSLSHSSKMLQIRRFEQNNRKALILLYWPPVRYLLLPLEQILGLEQKPGFMVICSKRQICNNFWWMWPNDFDECEQLFRWMWLSVEWVHYVPD